MVFINVSLAVWLTSGVIRWPEEAGWEEWPPSAALGKGSGKLFFFWKVELSSEDLSVYHHSISSTINAQVLMSLFTTIVICNNDEDDEDDDDNGIPATYHYFHFSFHLPM